MTATYRCGVFAAALLVGLAIPAHARRAPDLKLRDLSGNPQTLSSLRGHIVVMSFWATWCGPCAEELPRLSRLSATYASKDIRFIAVSIDAPKDGAKIQPFLNRGNIALEVWVGGDTDQLARFGLGDIVPGTVILDADGEIVFRIMGEARDEDIQQRLDWFLSGRKTPAPEAMTKRY
jgi:thiol-disulfide isomerase/thioredoxin